MRCGPLPALSQPAVAERREVAVEAARVRMARPGVVREVLLITALFLLYRLARLAITGHDTLAMQNALRVLDVERILLLPDEESIQDWFLRWPDLLKLANWYYVGVHFPLTAFFLAWGWLRRPPAEYRWARRLLTVLTGLALVGHVLLPLAPPRMLDNLGFLDTMAAFGPTAYSNDTAGVANQFAAMPSLHVGWALLIALVVIRTTRTPWRFLVLAHPLVTLLVVVVTANHYWVDAVAAGVLLALAWAVTPDMNGSSPVRRAWQRRRARQLLARTSRPHPDLGAGARALSRAGRPPAPRPPAD